MSCDINDYKCSDKGLILPLTNEYTWSIGFRAFIYIVGLLYSFMGVSIIADIFMQAIETITSRTTKIKMPDPSNETGYSEVEVKTWNGTVSNLTLMALGSSAPEILLSIIEIVGNGFKSGALGPSTIVGSAAFNLMCITGVCVFSIPDGVAKRIKHVKVFAVTSIFSVFAYVWLAIILMVITPDFIDLWESIVTLLLFPIMVILAYIADKDYCGKKPIDDESKLLEMDFSEGRIRLKSDEENLLNGDHADKHVIVEILRRLKREEASPEEMARLTAHLMEQNQSHGRGWYRINAIRNLSGGTKLTTPMTDRTSELLETLLIEDQMGSSASFTSLSDGGSKAIIEFAAPSTAVFEKDGHARITVMRHGNLKRRVLFRVETIDGTAVEGEDYISYKETIVFEPNETEKHIDIQIIDDNIWEPDEVFFGRITIESEQQSIAVVGRRAITQIVILNDDDPGVLEFEHPSFLFKESVGTALVPVTRIDGADGKITVNWKTKDMTAIHGRDYDNSEGTLTFDHGERAKFIEIKINDDKEFEKDENFEINLIEATGGAKLGKLKRTVVTIVNDDEFSGLVSRITSLTNANLDSLRLQKQTWGQQFVEAMNVNGGDLETATTFDYVMHFLTFGWKLIFACVPPATIWGGWFCFCVALIMIGILTAFIGDLAAIFGCLIGLDDSVVAITFVALGTSLPDLFASRTAALNEKYADTAIGNVTGSNGVNVFLGLGLPWTMAAIYWSSKGTTFEVPAGSLGFSVVVFTICSLLTIMFIILRRNLSVFGSAELGGPKVPKIISGTYFIVVWILYVLLVSLNVYEYIPGF
ncbi:sodium/calcium exchanger 3-like isoform X1 [Pecten maximus]|uniref:sodium/calcium exchanger 3-like isoform X1 n=1 Tax=Pecten maximus TaxID=6579 RepID=UPI00145911A9|nr:sodium/calcium exchanger 3-like isoform X1 [Pecten maximus]